jgi:putative two-component system response regulator
MTPFLAADGTPARILIVDDEPDNRELLQIMLRWEGFVTATASGGEEAIAAAEAGPPHLMLVDLMMPDMDGYEVVRRVKGGPLTKSVLVMIVSAMTDKASRVAAVAAGADDFLSKPIIRLELTERVKKLLQAQTAEPVCTVASLLLEAERSPAPEAIRESREADPGRAQPY